MIKQIILLMIVMLGLMIGCKRDADIASHNLSYAADNFELDRRVVFYNGITNDYMLEIIGKCSVKDKGTQLEVTCKTGPSQYKKHFLGLSDNVTYFAEQLTGKKVSTYHYSVTFKPQSILPDIDFKGNLEELAGAVALDGQD